MRTRLDDDLYASPRGALHYSVRYKADLVCNRVTARHFVGVKPEQIEWARIIESKRYAIPKRDCQSVPGKAPSRQMTRGSRTGSSFVFLAVSSGETVSLIRAACQYRYVLSNPCPATVRLCLRQKLARIVKRICSQRRTADNTAVSEKRAHQAQTIHTADASLTQLVKFFARDSEIFWHESQ